MGGVDRKVHSFRVSNPSLLFLLIVIELPHPNGIDYEEEHEHDYEDEIETTLSTFAYISR